MLSEYDKNKINRLASKYKLGKIKNIEIFTSSQNKVYKVETDINKYVIKEFSRDAIKNRYSLNKRKKQVEVNKIFNDNLIKTSLPILFKNKYFLLFEKKYYSIYNYLDGNILNFDDITIEHIKILSNTLSKIHNINFNINLPCTYKKININFNKYLIISKKIDNTLYNVLKSNFIELNDLIKCCNNKINVMKNTLCISHNDYKLLNMLWKDLDLILLDFDACGLSNPTCCLCESAFNFSYDGHNINFDYYRLFLEEYLKNYGLVKDNFKDSLYVCMNGKLQWFSYMLSKIIDNEYIEETKEMIKMFINYYNNIDSFYNIYLDVVKDY